MVCPPQTFQTTRVISSGKTCILPGGDGWSFGFSFSEAWRGLGLTTLSSLTNIPTWPRISAGVDLQRPENQYKETLPIMNVESLVFSVLFQTLHNESRDGKTLMLLCSSLISVAKSQVLKIQFLYFNIPKLKLEQQSS